MGVIGIIYSIHLKNDGELSSREVLKEKYFGDVSKFGQVKKGGVLLAEQDNLRLN